MGFAQSHCIQSNDHKLQGHKPALTHLHTGCFRPQQYPIICQVAKLGKVGKNLPSQSEPRVQLAHIMKGAFGHVALELVISKHLKDRYFSKNSLQQLHKTATSGRYTGI